MNNLTLRLAWALFLLVWLGLATPALADVGVPPHRDVGAKLGTCVAHVILLSDPSNMNLDNLKKYIVSQCQSETAEWNEWCRPLFENRHSVNYAVARCDMEWALTIATTIAALKARGVLHLKDDK